MCLEDFINCLKTGKAVEGVILTFDDGLNCHYEYAYKELKKGALRYFMFQLNPTESKIIDVHRIHLILGKHESKSVFKFLDEKLMILCLIKIN